MHAAQPASSGHLGLPMVYLVDDEEEEQEALFCVMAIYSERHPDELSEDWSTIRRRALADAQAKEGE